MLGAEVAGEDDDGVLEIHDAPLRVCVMGVCAFVCVRVSVVDGNIKYRYKAVLSSLRPTRLAEAAHDTTTRPPPHK